LQFARALGGGDQRRMIGETEIETQPEEHDRCTHRAQIIARSAWGGSLEVFRRIDICEGGAEWVKARNDPRVERHCSERASEVAQPRKLPVCGHGCTKRTEACGKRERLIGAKDHTPACRRHETE
jgi:hypothetical protein